MIRDWTSTNTAHSNGTTWFSAGDWLLTHPTITGSDTAMSPAMYPSKAPPTDTKIR